MAASTSYYAPDVSAFVMTLEANGVGHLRRTYRNPIDGTTMYALVVVLPHAGRAFEVHGASVDRGLANGFSPLGADECAAAFALGESVATLDAAWRFLGGVDSDDASASGLPSMLIVKVH